MLRFPGSMSRFQAATHHSPFRGFCSQGKIWKVSFGCQAVNLEPGRLLLHLLRDPSAPPDLHLRVPAVWIGGRWGQYRSG
jgi:hypothetical protein